MNIMIIHCHTSNRGDEAAVHAAVDELIEFFPNCNITLCMRGKTYYQGEFPDNVQFIEQYVPTGGIKRKIEFLLIYLTKGVFTSIRKSRIFIVNLRKADIILHAPGGPSIGDIYYGGEPQYLKVYDLIRRIGKPYIFYAPSMGPFCRQDRTKWRRKTLKKAWKVILRDPISYSYVRDFLPEINPVLTLDSALQHDIDLRNNQIKYDKYFELKKFIDEKKVIGITVTDLMWHPIYNQNSGLQEKIKEIFGGFIEDMINHEYSILFIPQLYGDLDDSNFMRELGRNRKECFILNSSNKQYDNYFQQYVISKLYAVVGMRYHSNVFSAKMGIPFVSISYEQKMAGFMEKMGLSRYCIELDDLSKTTLIERFEELVYNYDEYKQELIEKHDEMRMQAKETTKIVKEYWDCYGKNK